MLRNPAFNSYFSVSTRRVGRFGLPSFYSKNVRKTIDRTRCSVRIGGCPTKQLYADIALSAKKSGALIASDPAKRGASAWPGEPHHRPGCLLGVARSATLLIDNLASVSAQYCLTGDTQSARSCSEAPSHCSSKPIETELYPRSCRSVCDVPSITSASSTSGKLIIGRHQGGQ